MSYRRPQTLANALSIRAEGARVAAGCTDLFPAVTSQTLNLDERPILDITAIAALRDIRRTDEGWRIGAAATWSQIAAAALPPAFDGLKAAAKDVGAIQIQNAGTIGGNLCNASPAADGVPPLLTLDASVELAAMGRTRRLGLAEFLRGPRQTALADDELLTAVLIPASAGAGRSAFLKLGARRHLVISIVMAAVRIEVADGRIAGARLSIGACSAVAARLPAVEAALVGREPGKAAMAVRTEDVEAALAPISDMRADAEYRLDAAATMARRVVAAAVS